MINTIHLDKQGLEMFVGPTQTKVLLALWGELDANRKPKTIKGVHNLFLNNGIDLGYSTVSTVFYTLLEQGLIEKIPYTRPQQYKPIVASEQEFIDRCLRKLDTVLADNYNVRVR